MIKWNKEKNRVLYREDKEGNRTYPYQEDKPNENGIIIDTPKTKKEIMEALDEQGIKYNQADKKDDLLKLLEG